MQLEQAAQYAVGQLKEDVNLDSPLIPGIIIHSISSFFELSPTAKEALSSTVGEALRRFKGANLGSEAARIMIASSIVRHIRENSVDETAA